MQQSLKRTLLILIIAIFMLSAITGCKTQDTEPENEETQLETNEPEEVVLEDPKEPEELNTGEVKWIEEETADGYMLVTNEDGATLGYSKDSGVTLIQYDGYAFKDMNRNGMLDTYEDWRLDANTRAADLAAQLPLENIFGLMVHYSILSIMEDGSDATQLNSFLFSESMDRGIRTVLSFATGNPASIQATWNNTAQTYAESQDYSIPVNISANPTTFSVWAEQLALAATFDTDLVFDAYKMKAEQFRALGITTLLGPQADISSEPRWKRIGGTFGEDPALVNDMINASVSALQSTYNESNTDLGWGSSSVNAMIKHFTGDGAGESGRESHAFFGEYTVYPGGAFETALIPFVDSGLNLDSITKETSAMMTSYSIAYSEDGSLGELVGTSFSEYKIDLLRENYNYDGLICTDWDVDGGENAYGYTPWGVEDLTRNERVYMAILAGVDQIGGTTNDVEESVAAAYEMMVEEAGEEVALERFQNSARRVLRSYFQVGLFENSYVSVSNAKEVIEGEESTEAGYNTQLKSVVMLKNDGKIIKVSEGSEKPTVYIPMKFTAASNGRRGSVPASWSLPVDLNKASEYYNVITDTVGEPTGTADDKGNHTLTSDDIIRASAEELADCEYALVFVNNPSTGTGYDDSTETYIPISLQYGKYTANSSSVRETSIAGRMVEVEEETDYGVVTTVEQENRSYYGNSTIATNLNDLEMILETAENMPEGVGVVVAINSCSPMIFSEFESEVDAILMGFGRDGIDSDVFLDIASGQAEPSGLLPMQMPKDMETVEAQFEDVPRDMECYVDSVGNTYDFAYGMNWSGVISDERTAEYGVPALVAPVNSAE